MCVCVLPLYIYGVYGLAVCVCVFQDHLLSCPLVDIPCDLGCGVTISRCKIIEHHTVCNNRTVQCIHCKEDVQLNSMEVYYCVCVY